MKENFKTILIIASFALNLVFVGTYLAYWLPSISRDRPEGPMQPLFMELDLTPEQLTRFQADRERFRAQLQELGQEIKTKQMELVELLMALPSDQQAIEKTQDEIQRLQGAVQDRVITHFLEASAHLAPEQRVRFFQLVKQRIGTNVQVCPPWMKPLGKDQMGDTQK
jgi:Spy/CpxP family protein refolding chaperone